MLSRTASRKIRNEKSSRCSSPTNLSVKMDSWRAVTETASNAVCSATAKKTVAMDQTRTHVVSRTNTPHANQLFRRIVMSEVAFKSRNITQKFSQQPVPGNVQWSVQVQEILKVTQSESWYIRKKLKPHSSTLVPRMLLRVKQTFELQKRTQKHEILLASPISHIYDSRSAIWKCEENCFSCSNRQKNSGFPWFALK